MSQMIKDIAAHLAKQRKQSLRYNIPEMSSCAYRGVDNTMCAVGCLIPDELYDREIEGIGSEMLMDHFPKIKKHLREKYNIVSGLSSSRAFYTTLGHSQGFHDGRKYVEMIEEYKGQPDDVFAQAIEKHLHTLVED